MTDKPDMVLYDLKPIADIPKESLDEFKNMVLNEQMKLLLALRTLRSY